MKWGLVVLRFIVIEDLVANALIKLVERKSRREVSIETVIRYGMVVESVMRGNGGEAVLLLTKGLTDEFIKNYSDFFDVRHSELGDIIILKAEKNADDLRNCFRAFLSLDSLLAFTNEKALVELGIHE